MSAAAELPEPTVEQLVEQWRHAKKMEADAEAARVLIGNKLANVLGAPTEGAKSYDVGDFKVTVKQPINRKVDWAQFDAAYLKYDSEHPGNNIAAPSKIKRELDETGLKWIQANLPELYAELATAVTATPGRIGIEIKEKA